MLKEMVSRWASCFVSFKWASCFVRWAFCFVSFNIKTSCLEMPIVSCNLQLAYRLQQDMMSCNLQQQDIVFQDIVSQDIVSCYLSHPTSNLRIDCIKTWYCVLQQPTTRHLVLQPPTCVTTATSNLCDHCNLSNPCGPF